jgi:hypothetical protein
MPQLLWLPPPVGDCHNDIRWSPRLPKQKLRRLYELDALGIADEELLHEVGWCLYARCRDILTIRRATEQREVRCPRCDAAGSTTYIPRADALDEPLHCPRCGWGLTWREYRLSTKHRQLNPGGAVPAFERFVAEWERARSPSAKMLAIDRVVHAFHYSLRREPDRPTRAAAVNLISGRLTDVVQFLDTLSYGAGSNPELRRVYARWRQNLASQPWLRLAPREEFP